MGKSRQRKLAKLTPEQRWLRGVAKARSAFIKRTARMVTDPGLRAYISEIGTYGWMSGENNREHGEG